MQIKGNTQVTLDGRGLVTLRPSDHVATGGQGSVYRIGDDIIKIYHDDGKMRKSGLPEKIKLLTALKHPYVVAPKGLVLSGGDPVGYYMPDASGHALSLVFTNQFYQSPGFSAKQASTLVDRMREVFIFGHGKGAVLVDPNELNWHVVMNSKNGVEPRALDVDSWAIGRFPPEVIMPSIRDWHQKTFDERSDWFSWGIVTFQVYTGIHPYKGTLDGFKRGDLEGRMRANASVFAPGVRLNQAVRDFSCIPGPLHSWYEATFQKGERITPPSAFDTGVTTPAAARIMRVVTTGQTGKLVMEKIFDQVNDSAIRMFHSGVVLLASGKLFDLSSKRHIANATSRECEVVKVKDGWLIADWNGKTPRFEYVNEHSLSKTELTLAISTNHLLSYENRMFAVTEKGLTELVIHMFAKPLLSAGQTWGVMMNSTKWFDGVGVQDAMGATYAVLPFGETSCAQTRVRELDLQQVINAKSGNRFVSFVTLAKDGKYRKIDLVFTADYSTYQPFIVEVDGPELNLAILPKGVAATIVEDGELTIFVPTNGVTNVVKDTAVKTDMVLSNWGDKVMYIQNGAVWSLRMK